MPDSSYREARSQNSNVRDVCVLSFISHGIRLAHLHWAAAPLELFPARARSCGDIHTLGWAERSWLQEILKADDSGACRVADCGVRRDPFQKRIAGAA